MVDSLWNAPSIVTWVPFNEGWGQYDTARIATLFKAWDPTRLVNSASGWNDRNVGDFLDHHSYPNPSFVPLQPDRVSVLGEYGGGGLLIEDHAWDPETSFQYVRFETAEELLGFFRDTAGTIRVNAALGLSAAVYTQTTDVETEINGLMTYDRLTKLNPADIKAVVSKLNPIPALEVVLPSARDGQYSWSYILETPPPDWYTENFDATGWPIGNGGFGTEGTPGFILGTRWNSNDIWLRRSFDLTEAELNEPTLLIYHDEDAEVYINGQLAATLTGFTTNYTTRPIPAGLLKPGRNVIAIHCHQTVGGQGIDAGIVEFSD